MSAGEIAGLIAALAFVVLVALLALPLIRLTGAIEEARRSIERLTEESLPTLRGTRATVESVNASLAQAEGITTDVHGVSSNVGGLAALVTTAVGGPLIKVNAFSYGVRRALAHRRVEAEPARPTATGRTRRPRASAPRRASRAASPVSSAQVEPVPGSGGLS